MSENISKRRWEWMTMVRGSVNIMIDSYVWTRLENVVDEEIVRKVKFNVMAVIAEEFFKV